jgi:hypothetical protein
MILRLAGGSAANLVPHLFWLGGSLRPLEIMLSHARYNEFDMPIRSRHAGRHTDQRCRGALDWELRILAASCS